MKQKAFFPELTSQYPSLLFQIETNILFYHHAHQDLYQKTCNSAQFNFLYNFLYLNYSFNYFFKTNTGLAITFIIVSPVVFLFHCIINKKFIILMIFQLIGIKLAIYICEKTFTGFQGVRE